MISVLILCRDEAENLESCIATLGWCDDVVVLDSHSTDDTVAVAERLGARVFTRTFDDFAGQRNYAIDEIDFKYDWVFHLDADEHFTEALHAECVEKVKQNQFSGFQVPSKTLFMGQWLRRSGMYPVYQMRFHKLGEVRFVQTGHGQREGESTRGIEKLKEPYLHFAFSKGIDDWYAKHERYAQEEAEQARKTGLAFPRPSALVSGDPTTRRRALKQLSYRMPCRGLLRFIYMYVLRLGLLDGAAGLKYCRMLRDYERMVARAMHQAKEPK